MEKLHLCRPGVWPPKNLATDCSRCRGLCCTALYFARSEGFPADKPPGTPCRYLRPDFLCAIHPELAARGLRGCRAFDCLGAGQRLTLEAFGGRDPESGPGSPDYICEAFVAVWQLHQMLWYLSEAASLLPARPLWPRLEEMRERVESAAAQRPDALLTLDLDALRGRVNPLLRQTARLAREAVGGRPGRGRPRQLPGRSFHGANLDGEDFGMALLMAADLSGCSLRGACLLGADLRDADLRGADLSESLFLTPAQLSAARGGPSTSLPRGFPRPETWE